MTDQSKIDAATRRLALALDSLDAALDRRLDSDRNGATFSTQYQALGADRSRLAAELDSQTARARQLEATNREIARRLDSAMDSIRSVIDTHVKP
jgi:Domain of unknown function (DUF4164)